MSYFPAGHRVTGGEIDDFDDCDPVHYAGGYDIDLTYGRSLPPSYETCYPYRSSASDRPQFASHSKPSAYAVEALGSQYNRFSGPKARPEHPSFAGGSAYSGPRPNYGFHPGGGRNEYARPEPGYDPGVRKPESGFGGSRHESGGSGYGGWPERPTYPKPSYPQPSYPRPSYPEPSYPVPSYPEPSYPIPSYPEPSYPRPSYPEPNYPMPSYPEPSYPTPGYGLQKHEYDDSEHDRRKHHHQQMHRHDSRRW